MKKSFILMHWFSRACNSLPGLLLSLLIPMAGAAEVPAVAAASSLKPALELIAAQFNNDTGKNVRLSFSSSGNIYRQIRQGAPFEIFFSADEDYILQLAQADKTLGEGIVYAVGRLVLFAPRNTALIPDEQGHGLQQALAENRIQRFAIANPDHAPYGLRAREALQSLGLWESIKPKLVLGENVSQAAQFAISGSAQGGIFAYSLALTPAVNTRGSFVLLPEDLHQPLRQRMVLISHAGDTARLFYDYVQQPSAREHFIQSGFLPAGK